MGEESHQQEEREDGGLQEEAAVGQIETVPAGEPLPQSSKSILDDPRLTHVGAIIGVACWSLAGTALRLAIEQAFVRDSVLTTYSTYGSNCIGSYLMGFIASLASSKTQSIIFPWIFRSLLVGFCGSMTTFSTWMLDTVKQERVALCFGELVSGLTMPFVFFLWGRDTAFFLRACMMPALGCINGMSASRSELGGRQMHLANVVFLFMSIVAAVVVPVAIEASVHHDLLNVSFINRRSVLISPLGAVPRYLLAQLLNGNSRFWNFPIGTFAANMIAVFLMGLLDHFYRSKGNVWCKIAMDGLCGSLSTVSSFVNEIFGFYGSDNRRMMYIYAIISVAVGTAIMSVCRHVF
ncbi:hypothetical protein MOQ_001562 [Trypanosoma cruzi marinkellei]|uniref:CrcB-like protein n=1 Tax=Trypanosoma cruzi marinkellei TaxID=85056 RepID=K2MSG6_TRYCR|nr:hypothetical protein MOQ_001562 [Trypanosoma cruzi marinkellei]